MRVFALVLGLVLAAPLGLTLWTLDRGFDITDEANALLLAMHPASYKMFVSASHWVTAPLWRLTNNLVAYRAVGLCLILGSSALLGWGAWRAAVTRGVASRGGVAASVVVLCAMTAALHWDTYDVSVYFTPFYNLLAIAGSYAAIGLALLSQSGLAPWRRMVLHGLAGGCLGVAFLCKFPEGVDTFVLNAVLIATAPGRRRERAGGFALMAVGMAAIVVLFARVQMPLGEVLPNFKLGLKFYQTALPEPIAARLARDAKELAIAWGSAMLTFAAPLALFALYALWRRAALAALGVAVLTAQLSIGGYWRGDAALTYPMSHLQTQIQSLSAILLCGLLLVVPAWRRNVGQAVLMAALLATPYAIAIGTANSLPPQILVSLAPWAAFLALAAQAPRLEPPRRLAAMALCGLFVLTSSAQVCAAVFTGAYHVTGPLSRQDQPVSVGSLGVVRVDRDAKRFVLSMDAAAARCRIAPGTPFVGLYNIPGVAVVLKATPVLTTWLIDARQAQPWLAAAPGTTLKRAVIAVLVDPAQPSPPLPAALADFPRGYRFCGDGVLPGGSQRVQIWAP